MKYKHLSYSDRQEMEKLYLQGWHMNDIAAKLGVSLATVYHERARGDTGQIDISTTDYPQESAQALLAAEYVRKTKMYEPRARVVRVEWTDSKAHDGNMTPKVVIDLV